MMNPQIVTLTTDWGTKDFFSGMVKSKLLNAIPGVQIIDITHDVEQYSLLAGSFVVKNACLNFPAGTIHIIDINAVETQKASFIVVQYNDQYYICTDDGLPSVVFGNNYQSITQITLPQNGESYSFASYNIFCEVAALISKGTPLSEIGTPLESLNQVTQFAVIAGGDYFDAHVIYTDSYGNAYLDLTYNQFDQMRNGRKFTAEAHGFKIHALSDSYNASQSLSAVLLPSATGHLEIAICNASAVQLLALRIGDSVRFEFK